MKNIRIDKNGRAMYRVAVWHKRRRDGVPYCRHVWTYCP